MPTPTDTPTSVAERRAPAEPSPAGGSIARAFERTLETFRQRADRELGAFLTAKRSAAEGSLAQLTDSVEVLIRAGGKRLRPLLVDQAYRALGGPGAGASEPAVLPVALSTEMLHAYLLIHDDIMDHAEVRRGEPASHVQFRDSHRRLGWPGDAADFGRSVAILVGDLAHCWAVELFQRGRRHAASDEEASNGAPSSGLPSLDLAALDRTFCAMCEEVIGGQFLEMRMPFKAHVEPPGETELVTALRLKSGRYSVERPLELGAILAGADEAIRAALTRYGRGAGEAFQLQDDILGTFGDEVEVGKSVASDLREGKHTLLIHHTLERTSEADGERLRSFLGRDDLSAEDIEEARDIIRRSGGLARTRERIDQRLAEAREALDDEALHGKARHLRLTDEGRTFFEGMLDYLRSRKT